MPAIDVAQAFYDVLRARGVTRIFGNPGSNELTMLKNFRQQQERDHHHDDFARPCRYAANARFRMDRKID